MAERSPEELQQRRKRRAERRHKQRLANVARAEKMHQQRISAVITPLAEPDRCMADFYIGCSGWFYWHWKGKFYPEAIPTNQWFSIYQAEFETVELNAPFYSWPTIAAVRTWLRQAESSFVYTVKVCELITHVMRFEGTETLVRDFGFIADLLGSRMGCFLYQLPPSVHFEEAMLQRILGQIDPRHRNVVEFRHKSWWRDDVYAAFRAAGAIFCSCSGPRLPDDLIRTADEIYIRFHGTERWYHHDYSKEELEIWAERIQKCGAKTAWVYFNNDREGHAIKNAKMLADLLGGDSYSAQGLATDRRYRGCTSD
ncbi:hypothetical protein CPY51_09040 [Rhizobium tubonense]|uniref:DUF72 domain-containing protein n=1 Tax=Rhizobium tubonense TaxID=484088 RepID=A0A2W4CQW7_9HYPH|nr:hypothetical protein CPY51_09040 [Rhizobium tubonense]